MTEQDKTAPTQTRKNQGEGNYDATRRFDAEEKAFIDKNRADLPKLAKEAEAALDGPEGEELRAAVAKSKAHAAGMTEKK